MGFVYDLDSFEQQKTFFLAGEGWGITFGNDALIVSDGSAFLRFLDPETLQQEKSCAGHSQWQPGAVSE